MIASWCQAGSCDGTCICSTYLRRCCARSVLLLAQCNATLLHYCVRFARTAPNRAEFVTRATNRPSVAVDAVASPCCCMTYDSGLVARIADTLEALGERGIRQKNVFGGRGFLIGKSTFAIA